MRYDRSTINELLQRADIVDVIGESVPLKKTGKNYFACCPLPGHDEKTPSFSVNPKDQLYFCNGCGEGGNAINFLIATESVSFPAAVKQLARRVGYTLPTSDVDAPKKDETRSAYADLENAAKFYEANLAQSVNPGVNAHLEKRLINQESVERFRLGASLDEWNTLSDKLGGFKSGKRLSDAGLVIYKEKTDKEKGRCYDRFRDSLVFPIRDERGTVVAFAQGAIKKMSQYNKPIPKYLNGPETAVFKKSSHLYGIFETLNQNPNPNSIIVTEGYLDVVTAHQHGVNNVVGTMGTSISTESVSRLFRHTNEITFCFDGDKAGRTAAQRALRNALPELNEFKRVNFLFLPEGHDLDSILNERGAEFFNDNFLTKRIRPASSFIVHIAKNGCEELDTMEKRSLFFSQSRELIDLLPASPYKANMLAQMEDISGIKPREYLPFSMEINQGALRGVDIASLETDIKKFISTKIDAQQQDIKISLSAPQIAPTRNVSSPLTAKGDASKKISALMAETTRILSMSSSVDGGFTLRQLLITASTGEPTKRQLAQALLSRHLEDSQSVELETAIAANHLTDIKTLLESEDMKPTLDERTKGEIVLFLAQSKGQAIGFSSLIEFGTEDATNGIIQSLSRINGAIDATNELVAHNIYDNHSNTLSDDIRTTTRTLN